MPGSWSDTKRHAVRARGVPPVKAWCPKHIDTVLEYTARKSEHDAVEQGRQQLQEEPSKDPRTKIAKSVGHLDDTDLPDKPSLSISRYCNTSKSSSNGPQAARAMSHPGATMESEKNSLENRNVKVVGMKGFEKHNCIQDRNAKKSPYDLREDSSSSSVDGDSDKGSQMLKSVSVIDYGAPASHHPFSPLSATSKVNEPQASPRNQHNHAPKHVSSSESVDPAMHTQGIGLSTLAKNALQLAGEAEATSVSKGPGDASQADLGPDFGSGSEADEAEMARGLALPTILLGDQFGASFEARPGLGVEPTPASPVGALKRPLSPAPPQVPFGTSPIAVSPDEPRSKRQKELASELTASTLQDSQARDYNDSRREGEHRLDSVKTFPELPASRPTVPDMQQQDRPSAFSSTLNPPRVSAAITPTSVNAQESGPLSSLLPRQWVHGKVINEALLSVSLTRGGTFVHVDSLVHDAPAGDPSSPAAARPRVLEALAAATPSATLLCPVNLDNAHWILIAIVYQSKSVDIYDSLASITEDIDTVDDRIRTLVKSFFKTCLISENLSDWTVDHRACPQQRDSYNCGIAVICNAFYLVSGLPVSAAADWGLWRCVIARFLAWMDNGLVATQLEAQARVGVGAIQGVDGIASNNTAPSRPGEGYLPTILTLAQLDAEIRALEARRQHFVEERKRAIRRARTCTALLQVLASLTHHAGDASSRLADSLARTDAQLNVRRQQIELAEIHGIDGTAADAAIQAAFGELQVTLARGAARLDELNRTIGGLHGAGEQLRRVCL